MSRTPLALRLTRRWHKRIGLLAAAFFTYLALTGLFLNHSESVAPDSKVSSAWLMSWYGLKPKVPEHGFRLDTHWLVADEETWVLDRHPIKPGHGPVVGVVLQDGQIWVATTGEVSLYQTDGVLIDRVERDFLPALPLRRLGLSGRQQIVVDAGRGAYATRDGIAWAPLAKDAQVTWSRAQPLDEAERTSLNAAFAPSLSLARVVADVHSGRIFGHYGPLVTDALALSLLALIASGLWVYFKTRAGQGRKPHVRHRPQATTHPVRLVRKTGSADLKHDAPRDT